MFDVIIAGLATWRVSHMIVGERGPWDVFVRLRELFGIEHDDNGQPVVWPDNSLLSCIWCVSVWVAPIMLLVPWLAKVMGASAVAVLVEERHKWQ